RIAALRIAQPDPDHLSDAAGLDAEVRDVTLLLEDARHLALQPRGRDLDLLVLGEKRVADPIQVIRDRVGQHLVTSSTWSSRARSRDARRRANRSGRGRTCGNTPAVGRTCGSGCSRAF